MNAFPPQATATGCTDKAVSRRHKVVMVSAVDFSSWTYARQAMAALRLMAVFEAAADTAGS